MFPLNNLLNLQQLDISGTLVSDLSPIKNLQNLKDLRIFDTQVSDLSPLKNLIEKGISVKWSSKLWEGTGVYVENCPFAIPPTEVVQQGNEAILRYFDEKEKVGTDQIYEAKLLLIVRLHRHIAQGQSAVWNGGVVLERAGAQADIIESLDRR